MGAFLLWQWQVMRSGRAEQAFPYDRCGRCLGRRSSRHCLFYNPSYYLAHPLEIIKFWEEVSRAMARPLRSY